MFKLMTITTATGAIAFAGLLGQLNAKVDPPLCSEQEAVAIAKESSARSVSTTSASSGRTPRSNSIASGIG